MSKLIDHPIDDSLWRHEPPIYKPCWVCGEETAWILMDMAWQHLGCTGYPSEEGDVKIIDWIKQ